MLNGENERTAKSVARQLRIESESAEMMPESKVEQIESYMGRQQTNAKQAYVGDE